MQTLDQLNAQLDKLASLEKSPFPVVSLYLDLQPNERGRDNFEPFLRKELAERLTTYEAGGPERDSLEQDAEKIQKYVGEIEGSLNGLALFTSSGGGLFEAMPLAAPLEGHRLFIGEQPHLYPLAKLLDQYPRYVALVADTNSARIFVFAGNAVETTGSIEGTKTRRHKMGGWSQARYQRHVENYHLHHAKEVVEAVARIVRDEGIDKVVIAGDDVIVPLLRDQMPKDLAERIVDVVKLDIRTPEREVLETTLASLREKDAEDDRERVDALVGAVRAGGLGAAGIEATKRAFELGQVDELLIPATPDALDGKGDELVALARQTAASIRFIEDASLMAPLRGVGAFLRFKV
jgi:peptide chain release factor subunit 1